MDRVHGYEVGASLTLLKASNDNISRDIAVVDVVACENRYGLLCVCDLPFINSSPGRKGKVTLNCTSPGLLWNDGFFDDAALIVVSAGGGGFLQVKPEGVDYWRGELKIKKPHNSK